MDLYRNATFTFSNEWLHSKNSQETSDGVNGPRVLNVVGTSLPCQLEVGLTVSSLTLTFHIFTYPSNDDHNVVSSFHILKLTHISQLG
jgi:hypothetical protein